MKLYTPNGGGIIHTNNEATIKAKLAMGFTTDSVIEKVVEEVVKEAILDEEEQ